MIKKTLLKTLTLVLTIIISLTGCASNGAFSQKGIKTDNKDIKSKISKYLEDYSATNEFSGTILVAKDDEVLIEQGYGMADYDKSITNKLETVFEIGSITKQFTATAILMLQEKNFLNIQDTISKYIQDYPDGNKIKIYNLLTHTSGIPDYFKFDEPWEKGKRIYTPNELIDLFKNKPLAFNIGTKFEYSNSNYILLGYIIEKVSGMKYEDYIEKNILKPLKLNNTGFLVNQVTTKDNAIGYFNDKVSNKYKKTSEIEGSYLYACAGIYSTVDDLYTWVNALNGEKLIKKESLNEMFTPYLNNYCYGWYIDKSSDGNNMVYHWGSIPGYTSYISRNIKNKYVIIVLSNKSQNNYNMNKVILELQKILETKK